MPILSFVIGKQQYGFRIVDVREVVPLPALTDLVGAPPVLKGLLNLRGDHIPVLDGRVLVGAPQSLSLSNQIIVLGHELPELGLLVDQVCDVLPATDVRAEMLGRDTAAAVLQAVITVEQTSLLLFDLDALRTLVQPLAQKTVEL